jgi:hypothetical protein
MSGPNYSHGVVGSFDLDASDVQNFFDDVHTGFTTCQWTVVKQIPSSSGTHGYQFKSVATASGTQILVNVYWDGTTMVLFGYPIIKFEIDVVSETRTTAAGLVTITNNKLNRMICGPHQFFVFFDYTVSPDPTLNGSFDRNDATGGIPYRVTDSGDAFWTLGCLNSWRYGLFRDESTANGQLGFLLNGVHVTAKDPTVINPQLLSLRGSQLLEPTMFVDFNYPVINPMLVMGKDSTPIVLSLWDAVVVGGFFSTKVNTTADLREWESFTLQGSALTTMGCLFLATHSFESTIVGSYSH